MRKAGKGTRVASAAQSNLKTNFTVEEKTALEAVGNDILKRAGELLASALPVESSEVQDLMAEHYEWVGKFSKNDKKTYLTQSVNFVLNQNMMRYLNNIQPGLAFYMREATSLYAKNNLK